MMNALLVSAGLAVWTVMVHMVGLGSLLALARLRTSRIDPHGSVLRQALFILIIVLGLFVLHAVEIWSFAMIYLALGAVTGLEEALYFSTSTFTTLGYGDVIIDSEWRLVSAMEGFTGFLMIGWSTAFLVSIVGRLRALEADWLDRPRDGD
ncbi:potassium channel family protein [Maricaulis sp.]|uniref:potassium channel family protein n=1 Tax=Maricaulis sp. TaxID=1486257 RepID=UPI0025BBD9E4|nr:potassium channel family protein [Maricaulis sp.]